VTKTEAKAQRLDGAIAYAVYVRHLGGPAKDWNELSLSQQGVWIAAAAGVKASR
jgi:hypothetical protein